MNEWRVIDTGFIGAAENMALDKTILRVVNEKKSPPTLRFMFFDKPVILVGYNQNVADEVKVEYCIENKIPINRRITGGGAILMDRGALGWELVAQKDVLPKGPVENMYKLLCEGCVNALQKLGVDAKFRPHNDIEINGRKVSGSGGTEEGDTFLYHGSLLIDFNVELMLKTLNTPLEKLKDKAVDSFKERMTWLSRECNSVPKVDELKESLTKEFSNVLGFNFVYGDITEYEKKQYNDNLNYFRSDNWIYQNIRKKKKEYHSSIYKAAGGCIRTYLIFDRNEYISQAVINGDFFVYPSRLLRDFESMLKNCRVKDIESKTNEFFNAQKWEIPGVTPADFITAIKMAIVSE
ncbi:MAG: hypothetical protein DBX47_07755 [Clostridiales bacterium]|nr:MAG: hypothetical protein DBX47_07755 [Clostridiales bacterium]